MGSEGIVSRRQLRGRLRLHVFRSNRNEINVTNTWYYLFWFAECSQQLPKFEFVSFVTLSNSSGETTPSVENSSDSAILTPEPDESMQEYYLLQKDLLILTAVLTVVIFATVCFFYPLKIALNYLLGGAGSVVYLRMLSKDVEKLGRQQQSLSKTRLAILVGLIILATQWNQLQILPIFLGFLTYKAALILYVLKTVLMPETE